MEIGHAVLDTYGNLVYGDGARKSAKLVLLAQPRLCGGEVGDGDGDGDDNHKNNIKDGNQQHASTHSLSQSSSSYLPKSAVEDGAVRQQQSITTATGTSATKVTTTTTIVRFGHDLC
jgi:hypothetical protein